MSISEYPYEIHRSISHGCQFRNIHTKSTDRYPVDVPSGYPYEIHRTISHGCQFRNIHTKSTDRYPVDVNFGISIRNPQNDIPWMSISEYPYEIHGPISRGCPLWISIRNPQNDIPWMSISEYPTKTTDQYPQHVTLGKSIPNSHPI